MEGMSTRWADDRRAARVALIGLLGLALLGCGSGSRSDVAAYADAGGTDPSDSAMPTEVEREGSPDQMSSDADPPPPRSSGPGSPCAGDADCGSSGSCIPETGDTGDTGFLGGYCVEVDCSDATPCPAGSACFTLGEDFNACIATCASNADCRGGYVCDADSTCWPG